MRLNLTMASGGDYPKKSTSFKDFLSLGRKAVQSPDVFKDAQEDLSIPKLPDSKILTKPFGAGVPIPSGSLDPKQSKSGLMTQLGQGSRSDLRPIETDKTNPSNTTGFAFGSFQDTGTKPKSQPHPTKRVVVEKVEPQDPVLKEEIRENKDPDFLFFLDLLNPEKDTSAELNTFSTNLRYNLLNAERALADAKEEIERVLVQFNALKAACDVVRQTVPTTKPPQVNSSILTKTGNEHSGNWPVTGNTYGGSGGKGVGKPDRGNDLPLKPSTNDDRYTATVVIQDLIYRSSGKQSVKTTNKSNRQDSKNTDIFCPVCRDDSHELSTCPKFRKLSTHERYAVVQSSKSCFHCLNKGHLMSACDTNKGILCGINGCKRYENPLIHPDKAQRKFAARNVSSQKLSKSF